MPHGSGLDWLGELPALAASLEALSPDLGKVINYIPYSSEAGTHCCVFLAGFWLDAALLPLGLTKAPALPRPCSR